MMKTRFFYSILIVILTLASFSCSNFFEQTHLFKETQTKTNAYIKLTLDNAATAKTVLPTSSPSSFTNLVLKGTKDGRSEEQLGTWATVSAMQNATLPISTGTWTFTLTAKQGGTTFCGKVQKETIVGENTLSFNLSISDLGTETGSFRITLNYSSAINANTVSYARASLENIDGTAVNEILPQLLSPTYDSVTFTANEVAAGTYRARIIFYSLQNVELATYRELVQVSSNLTSTATRSIESFDDLYSITYNLNGGTIANGTTLTETYTRKIGSITLPELTRRYYTFNGWYTDSACTDGNEITTIQEFTPTRTVYAKFTPTVYTIQYELNGGTILDDLTTEYTVEDSVALPEPEYDNKPFYGWYVRSDFYGNEVIGWDSGTCYENVIFHANWEGYKVTSTDVVERINSMRKRRTLKVIATGSFSTYLIRQINQALKDLAVSQPDIRIILDLSATTNLTNLEGASSDNANYSFYGCDNLVEIALPNALTNIGKFAFYHCTNLKTVTTGNNVRSIGVSAFNGCSYLTNFSIPNSVSSIGDSAFSGCSNITCIEIPDGITSISSSAFSACTNLTRVTVGNNVSTIGDYAFDSCNKLTEITIPNSVIDIGNYAFRYCSGLTEITIPDSVITIGDGAFYNFSSNITSVTLGNNVTSIGNSAFYYCSKLTEITIPNSVTNIGQSAFGYCSALASVTIGNGVTTIGDMAFESCSKLTEITIPNSVTSIGDYAFRSCSALASITIPDSVTTIGENAFSSCSALTNVYYEGTFAQWYAISFSTSYSNPCYNGADLFIRGENPTFVEIPAGETNIKNIAFKGCSHLTSVMIPNSVTSIGDYAFSDCSTLSSLTIPNSVTSIGDYAFRSCSALASITIPDSVTTIGENAFSGCSALTNVYYEGTFLQWYDISFSNSYSNPCYNGADLFIRGDNQTCVEIPAGEPCIKDYAFQGCSNLTSVIIPDGVNSIGQSAFKGCSNLASVTIPNSVTSIGYGSFYGCTNLSSITIPNSVTSIGTVAFSECSGFTSIIIGNSVSNIGQSAFQGCSNLNSVTIPSSVDWIGSGSFSDCTNLKSVTF